MTGASSEAADMVSFSDGRLDEIERVVIGNQRAESSDGAPNRAGRICVAYG
jgi:hypothetical protein